MIGLRKIDTRNIWEIVKLKVKEDQKNFVETNSDSILEAYAYLSEGIVAQPFGIYNDDVPVGFIMVGFGSTGDKDDPPVADGNYCLWRFMIDENYQKSGFGKAALHEAIDYIRTLPFGAAEYCWLSYEPENAVAKSMYMSTGFVENGQMCGNEIVAVLKL